MIFKKMTFLYGYLEKRSSYDFGFDGFELLEAQGMKLRSYFVASIPAKFLVV